MTVKEIIERYAAGTIDLGVAIRQLEDVGWRLDELTPAQTNGQADFMPNENSPDWITIVPIDDRARYAFNRVFDGRPRDVVD